MNRALLVVALCLAASSCGSPTIVCGPNNCTGCCSSTEVCDPGTQDSRCGKGGGACDSCNNATPLCVAQACSVESLAANAKLLFVTRTSYDGNLGGLSGADALCAAAAGAGSLPGTWRAWLSTSGAVGVNAFDRIQGDGPWYLTGTDASGRRVKAFSNKASLRTAPLAPIDRNELGVKLPGGQFVWTGTAATGNALVDRNCTNWTSNSSLGLGTSGDVYADWTDEGQRSCTSSAALYCFQQ